MDRAIAARTIRDLRREARMSEEQLASLLELSVAQLQAIERGEAGLPVVCLGRLARAMDVPLEILVADLYGAPGETEAQLSAQIHALVQAYTEIRCTGRREALLEMALLFAADTRPSL